MKYLLVLFLCLVLPLHLAEAQNNLQYGSEQLNIDLEPLFPAPESEFTASVNDYALPIQGVGITWHVDGKLVKEAADARDLKLKTKTLGSNTTVKVSVILPSGGVVSVEKVIKPVFLDIIIEPQTRTPAFYAGRALPSSGSTVNATAILNGNTGNAGNLLYTWRLNNKVLEGGSVRGKNTITFTMPLGLFATLNLEVRTATGEPMARRSFNVTNQAPNLSFYTVSTLYGLTEKAVAESIPLIGSSVTLRAEPFYLDLATYNNPDHLEWKIGGTYSKNDNGNPYEVTLAAQGGSGVTNVNFHVRNTVHLLQGAQDSFRVTY